MIRLTNIIRVRIVLIILIFSSTSTTMAESATEEYVWYFGYGSNMNSSQLTAGKGVVPLESAPAKLEGWRLSFNMVVVLKSMGSMANVVPDPNSTVHGTLHKFTKPQLALVDDFEAEGKVYKRVLVPVVKYDGEVVQANVYTALPNWVTDSESQPSLRYKTILVNGAKDNNVHPDYIAFLEALVPTAFTHDKDRTPPPIPDKMFTREELKDTKDKLSFMGVVFDVSGLNPMMKEMLTRYGPPEWMLLRLMPCKGSEKPVIPENYSDLTSEQLFFLDSNLHAMELEWPILGRSPLPVSFKSP